MVFFYHGALGIIALCTCEQKGPFKTFHLNHLSYFLEATAKKSCENSNKFSPNSGIITVQVLARQKCRHNQQNIINWWGFFINKKNITQKVSNLICHNSQKEKYLLKNIADYILLNTSHSHTLPIFMVNPFLIFVFNFFFFSLSFSFLPDENSFFMLLPKTFIAYH